MSSADASQPQSPANAGWKYDLVAFLDGDFGLAVAARNTLRALEASGNGQRAAMIRAGPGVA
jgi:hypothetical protein